jgi:nitroreductase
VWCYDIYMHQDIQKILELAVAAPSGENCQPWRFVVRGREIRVFNVPGRDQGLYNFRQRGSYIAHGAALENIALGAPRFGYTAQIELFPDERESDLVARVRLTESSTEEHVLYPYISERVTNRKGYMATPLTAAERAALKRAGDIRFVEDAVGRARLSRAIAINERLIFEHRPLHSYLFDNLRWTPAEEEQYGRGLSLQALEVPPPVQVGFKTVFKRWGAVQVLNRIGFSKFVSNDNAKTYASSAALGAVVVPGDSRKDFVAAGRMFQRMWLYATQLGLSVHPVTALVYLWQRLHAGETGGLSASHAALVDQAYRTIAEGFGVGETTIAMTFRIGRADPPSARSYRLPPDVVFE